MTIIIVRDPVLDWINGILSILSLLAEIFVIITYNSIPELKTFRSRLVIGLIFSDIIATISNIILYFIFHEWECILNGWTRQYGFTSAIIWVCIISYASRKQSENLHEDLSKSYNKFRFLAWILPIIPTLLPLIGNITNLYEGYIPQFIWCSQSPVLVMLNFYLYVIIGLIFILIQYSKMHAYLKKEAALLGAENVIEAKKLFVYPAILILSWTPALINRIYYWLGDQYEILTILHVLGAHSQGLTDSIFYIISQRKTISAYLLRTKSAQAKPSLDNKATNKGITLSMSLRDREKDLNMALQF